LSYYADDRPRGAINIDGNCAPPLRGHAGEKARVEHIEAVQRQNKRNLQTPRQQGCRVAAGQSGMGVDDVNRSLSVEPRHLGQQASVEPPPRARQAQIPGNLRVAKPIRRRRRARLLSTMMEGGDGDDAGSDSKVLKLPRGFRNEAAADLIVRGGKEWRQR